MRGGSFVFILFYHLALFCSTPSEPVALVFLPLLRGKGLSSGDNAVCVAKFNSHARCLARPLVNSSTCQLVHSSTKKTKQFFSSLHYICIYWESGREIEGEKKSLSTVKMKAGVSACVSLHHQMWPQR